MRTSLLRDLGLLALLCAAVSGCKPKEEKFESVCQLIRREVVSVDEKGPVILDVELEWDPCPGDQFQVVRGGREFAACMAKYKIGDFLAVHVVRHWDTRGYYEWDLSLVGDCPHEIEWDADGSYEKSQECTDDLSHNVPVGFKCSRQPVAKLLQICPWTQRR